MRAAILEEFGRPLVVEEVELLPPAPDGLIVRTGASAFCITDCTNQRGDLGKQLPTVLGHSGMGVVEEVGPLVTRTKVGDRVIVPGTPECRQCYWCVHGRPTSARTWSSDSRRSRPRAGSEKLTSSGGGGTYAEAMRVRESWVFPVRDRPARRAARAASAAASRAGWAPCFNAARVEPGSSVAVLGCGHLGLWMVQAARVAGAAQIIAVEERADRREHRGELGATDLVDPADGDTVGQVQALTGGRGADYALEAAGPRGSTELALLLARRAGVVVLTGLQSIDATVTFSQFELALRGRDSAAARTGAASCPRDIPRFIDMMERGGVDAAPIITAPTRSSRSTRRW